MIGATPIPLSEAKAQLPALARRVRQQHERFTLTRNGEPETVLLSVDDLEGLGMTLEILGDSESVQRISESLLELGRGDAGVDPRPPNSAPPCAPTPSTSARATRWRRS